MLLSYLLEAHRRSHADGREVALVGPCLRQAEGDLGEPVDTTAVLVVPGEQTLLLLDCATSLARFVGGLPLTRTHSRDSTRRQARISKGQTSMLAPRCTHLQPETFRGRGSAPRSFHLLHAPQCLSRLVSTSTGMYETKYKPTYWSIRRAWRGRNGNLVFRADARSRPWKDEIIGICAPMSATCTAKTLRPLSFPGARALPSTHAVQSGRTQLTEGVFCKRIQSVCVCTHTPGEKTRGVQGQPRVHVPPSSPHPRGGGHDIGHGLTRSSGRATS